MSDELDQMDVDMARIERMRAYFDKTFGLVHMTVGWAGETWEELYRKDVQRRMREFMKTYSTSGRRYGYRDRPATSKTRK